MNNNQCNSWDHLWMTSKPFCLYQPRVEEGTILVSNPSFIRRTTDVWGNPIYQVEPIGNKRVFDDAVSPNVLFIPVEDFGCENYAIVSNLTSQCFINKADALHHLKSKLTEKRKALMEQHNIRNYRKVTALLLLQPRMVKNNSIYNTSPEAP